MDGKHSLCYSMLQSERDSSWINKNVNYGNGDLCHCETVLLAILVGHLEQGWVNFSVMSQMLSILEFRSHGLCHNCHSMRSEDITAYFARQSFIFCVRTTGRKIHRDPLHPALWSSVQVSCHCLLLYAAKAWDLLALVKIFLQSFPGLTME